MPTTNDVNINNIELLMPDYKLLKNIRNATKNDPTIVKKTSRNSNVDTEDEKSGMTPLLYAIFNEHTKIAKRLIDLDADVDRADKRGKTPLMYASDNCNLDMVELLINKGANVEAKSGELTAELIANYKLENAENAKDKDMIDKCGEVLEFFDIALKKKHGGRRLKRRATKKNRRVSKSKRYTRAKQ